MSTTPQDHHTGQDGTPDDPQQIEADIARHRAELGETVDELTDRMDVTKRARRTLESARTRVDAQLEGVTARLQSDDHRDVLSVLAPAVGVVAVVLLLVGVTRRARR
ncbi:DUF3618 domain-containing protein [Serinicoccus chungangensis]|uniref:DUF3618 domain-containing protein n=1 Tax=Serinicoccus chungangensis TaxID=767452 RepID=UPI00111B9AC4|nr:DUF3618 domain-containing protein [Serinicoccus chungangensis]